MKIGILGAGQLGRMLALAAYPLGLNVKLFDPSPQSSAGMVAPHQCAHYGDQAALEEFVQGLDVVTYEFENVPLEAAQFVSQRVPVLPGVAALATSQERFAEKRCFTALQIPTAEYVELSSSDPIDERLLRLREFGAPCVLKTRRLGYDGKGQLVVRSAASLDAARTFLESGDVLAERLVAFTRELSLIAVRTAGGEVRCYPLVENVHHEGILRTSRCPAISMASSLQHQAEDYAKKIMEQLSYVGVLTIEFFDVDGQLYANEMAPRVHNSGHWTIEGAATSQFENHIRAICGLPLGSTELRGSILMVNIIGYRPEMARLLVLRDVHVHWYGKLPRPGRKVGHVTAVFKGSEERERRSSELLLACREPS